MKVSKSLNASEFAARVQVFLHGTHEGSLLVALGRRVLLQFVVLGIWITALPVTLVLHLAGFRRLTVLTQRIGHLAAEMDCFAKARRLGELPSRRWFVLAPPGKVANRHLLGYWKREVMTISHPAVCFMLHSMSRWLLMKYDVSHYVLRLNATQDLYRLNAIWGPRPPVIALSAEDREWGRAQLETMGIPRDVWFVCVHVREAGFFPEDEGAHGHRNADPRNTIPAMQEIVRRGGRCIRMGDSSMTRLPPIPGVVDYAHHPLKSDRLDIVICAIARCLLGSSSGLALVSSAFGVPSILTNMIPMSTLAALPSDLSIPKLLGLPRESRLLRFEESLGSPIGDYRYASQYENAGVVPVENSAEDILDLVKEMLDRLEGEFAESVEDRALQGQYKSLFRPGHYSYGAASRVGTAFLRKHRQLLVQ